MGRFSHCSYKMLRLLLLACIAVPALSRSANIVGGDDAEVGAYPWQISLQYYGSHKCGASLISAGWAVTAAHCLSASTSAYSLVIGLHDRTTKRYGEPKTYQVSAYYKHPDWTQNGWQGFPNDIAVMKLASEADISEYAQPIRMAEPGDNFVGNPDCYITGWGRLGAYQGLPNILQEAHVDVYSKSDCQSKHGSKISDYHVCVGKYRTSGACMGDSGGPLVCKQQGEYVLVGATSWGRSDCTTSYPSVYASIAYYRDWIYSKTGV